MSRRLLSCSVLIVLALALLLPVRSAADRAREVSMGSDGEVYFVREGSYGELLPEQGLAAPENPALALDVIHRDGTLERYLVPGTETVDSEDSASILFEGQSETVFVLWQTRINLIHSRLNLIGYHDGEWTEPIEISGNPFGWKSSPQIAITRDSFQTEEADGSLRTWKRTVVHLFWWEEGASGEPLAHYSPVVLLDGSYTGWNPVLRLDDLAQAPGAGPLAGLNLPLAQAPRIDGGVNGQGVVIGFVLPETGELGTWTAEVLPGEFSFLADKVRHQIIEIGRDLGPDQPTVLADRVRHQIIEIGNRLGLHPSLPGYAALQASAEIEAASDDGEDPVSLADKVRHQIIEIGARMTHGGLDRGTTPRNVEMLEIASPHHPGAPPNLIRLAQVSSRPGPTTGEGENSLFLSRDGREVVVSWPGEGVVYYRESRGEGWSPVRSLILGQDLDRTRAQQILKQRAEELGTE